MVYGQEAELKMLQYLLEVSRIDRIKNWSIRGLAQVGRIRNKSKRGEVPMVWTYAE